MINSMNYKHLASPYLEALTTNELIKIADSLGIDIPPDLDRIFIIQELLETNADLALGDKGNFPAAPINEIPLIEPVLLPKQYNINYIEILLRDSLWAFAYWEVKSHDRDVYESAPNFAGYFLNVVTLSGKDPDMVGESFPIGVGNSDNTWGIYIQPQIESFRVDLCVKKGETEEIIISSKDVRVPRIFDPLDESIRDLPEYPILSLSGIEEFEVLRNVDRVSRMRRLCED